MLSETDRAHLARYEAFLALASEMIGLGEVEAVARLMSQRFKYICDIHSWRYLATDRVTGDAGEARYALWYAAGHLQLGRLDAAAVTDFERECWLAAKAVFLDSTTLDERIAELPMQFRDPEILQLYVHPLWAGGRLEALFFASCSSSTFDRLDTKFIALAAQFLHRKVSHLRIEKSMTDELIGTLDHLRHAQDDLIQAEKLAALGSMVAGVSHELNTPIANAVLMSSSLNEHFGGLSKLINQAGVRRSDLQRWLGGAHEMGQLLEQSVNRAATLVASFKQVAVDQTSERRRVFDLRATVEDMLSALRPGLKGTPIEVCNEVPKGIECDTFPGPLGQIVSNLVQNAALHAFEGRGGGRICVDASAAKGQLSLRVIDDGIGMDTATFVHIFEPFFTTKLGKGGSGLGLAICNRIATTILAGELRAVSTVGAGTCFTLTMPQRTPRKI